jgi:hypothetical protein
MEEKLERREDMGLGKMASPDMVFARTFRWTLQCKHFREEVVKSVKINHRNRELAVELYDMTFEGSEFQALKWLTQVLNQTPHQDSDLLLTTYDGCGNPLYGMKFRGIYLLEHQMDLDYEISEVITQKAVLGYTFCGIGYHEKPKTAPKSPPVTVFEAKNDALDEKIKAMTQRAAARRKGHVNIEQTKVDFLNGACFIPGRETK